MDVNEENLGEIFTDKDGDEWEYLAHCPKPTVVMERLKDKKRIHEAVGCPNLLEHKFIKKE